MAHLIFLFFWSIEGVWPLGWFFHQVDRRIHNGELNHQPLCSVLGTSPLSSRSLGSPRTFYDTYYYTLFVKIAIGSRVFVGNFNIILEFSTLGLLQICMNNTKFVKIWLRESHKWNSKSLLEQSSDIFHVLEAKVLMVQCRLPGFDKFFIPSIKAPFTLLYFICGHFVGLGLSHVQLMTNYA